MDRLIVPDSESGTIVVSRSTMRVCAHWGNAGATPLGTAFEEHIVRRRGQALAAFGP
jgi:hypothetical protein